MGSIYILLAIGDPTKGWGHFPGWANSVIQEVSGPPESRSGCSWNGCSMFGFAFAILSLSLGHGNVFLAAAQEKTSPKPGGMFQPNLGRHVSVIVFVFEFVSKGFFPFNPLLLLKLVSILDHLFSSSFCIYHSYWDTVIISPPHPPFKIVKPSMLWKMKMFVSIAPFREESEKLKILISETEVQIHYPFSASL